MNKPLSEHRERKFVDEFSGNLAIFCSDERFVQATMDFLKEDLGIKTCDLVVVAGGPIFISQNESSLVERLNLLINFHQIKKIILISHENCGYYKHFYPELSSQTLEKLQVEDLRKALDFLKEKGVEGRAFFAYIEKEQIFFREIK